MNDSAPAAYFKKKLLHGDGNRHLQAHNLPGLETAPGTYLGGHLAVLDRRALLLVSGPCNGSRTAADNAELSAATHLKRF
jgi:hypothetical protein